MKKFVLTLVCGAFALSLCLGSVEARPKYPKLFGEHYKDNEGVSKAAAAAKCNVCHDPKDKKVRNEYGKAVNKSLTKADWEKLGKDDMALAKKVDEALKAAEEEKNADGKTFGEIIKGGKLPAG